MNTEEKEPTQQEIDKFNQKLKEGYEAKIPLLKLQCEFEELYARIEKARLDRTKAMLEHASIAVEAKEMADQAMAGKQETKESPLQKV
jgi:hypothetical protein